MRIKNILLVAVMSLTALSCSSKKANLSKEYFAVTPQVLEAIGGKVSFTIDGRLPSKFLGKTSVLEITPILKWRDGQVMGDKFIYQGEKVMGNEKVISYSKGGRIVIKEEFKFVPKMELSELYLDINLVKGSKKNHLGLIKVADGVNATSEILKEIIKKSDLIYADDSFQRIIKEKRTENIMFLVNQSNIRNKELKVADLVAKNVKDIDESEDRLLKNVEVSSYASPEGLLSVNTKLAEQRERNTYKALDRSITKQDVEDVFIDTEYTAEDWEGFKELVEKSNIPDKNLILRVLSMYTDPAQREQEIRKISTVYKSLADDIMPKLRRSRITINYEIIGKTDHEIKTFAKTKPEILTVEELLYAATLTKDLSEKKDVYNKAYNLFPNDYRSLNNLAAISYKEGKIGEAKEFLYKAQKINNASEANSNLALISLLKDDISLAEELLGRASGTKGVESVMGNIYIAKGMYDKASLIFGDIKSNAAALVQIMNKEYAKAKQTLAELPEEDGYTYYMKAIIGARTGNVIDVVDNLRKSFVRMPELKSRALNDIEFVRYYTDNTFINLMY